MTTKLTTEQFVERAKKVHNDQYDYQLVEYETNKKHVSIVCPVHGIFDKAPHHHLNGQGCPTCSRERLLGGYTEELFRNKPHIKAMQGVLYLVRFDSDDEMFYKIGITSRSVEERFSTASHNRYLITIIAVLHTTLYNAYQFEQEILSEYSHLRYVPQKRFSGWTECLMLEGINMDDVMSYF